MAGLLLRRDFTVAVVVLLVAIQAVVRYGSHIDSAVAWYLYAGGRFLDGAALYSDIFELNPPLALWLCAAVVALARGLAVDPTLLFKTILFLLTGVSLEMDLSCEETFGPVAGLIPFETEDDALRMANDTPYGLAAYFFSRDVGRVWRISEGLEAGIVGINTGFISTEVAPFGGVKESGIGREGSKYGIDEWLELKYLAVGGLGR